MERVTATVKPTRRHVLATGSALALAASTGRSAGAGDTGQVLSRAIPQTGELLPAVGLGTAIVFDVGEDRAKLEERRQVVQALVANGGRVIDTAPAYGTAEATVGALAAETGLRPKLFLATKLGIKDAASSRAELQQSLTRLRSDPVDLVQLWNVRDPNQDLAMLRDWKAAGHCRYVGITTSNPGDLDALAATCRREKPDFIQVNYSMTDREAEAHALAAAQEVGAAVLVNLPFGRGNMFRLVRGKSLPDWSAEFDAATWGQFFLKWLLSNQTVTTVIPGTTNAEHMLDNLGAARGRLPDAAQRGRMLALLNDLG